MMLKTTTNWFDYEDMSNNLNFPVSFPQDATIWDFVNLHFFTQAKGDCITLANVCTSALCLLGIPAFLDKAWPTTDTDEEVSTGTCTFQIPQTRKSYNGYEWDAELRYSGGIYEGFFWIIDDQHRVAYTVAAPAGPLESHPSYMHLEVLRSQFSGNPEQYWASPRRQAHGETVLEAGDRIPDVPAVPVPNIPD